MIVPKYFEDFDHLHVNTMPNRAYYIPASQVFPKGSVSIALFDCSGTVLKPQRASQFVLKVIVPFPILFICCHVPIPEVSLALAFFCPLQKVMVLSG